MNQHTVILNGKKFKQINSRLQENFSVKLIRTGKNTMEIETGNGVALCCYGVAVAFMDKDRKFYKNSQSYGRPTTRLVNKWLEGEQFTEMPPSYFESILGGV